MYWLPQRSDYEVSLIATMNQRPTVEGCNAQIENDLGGGLEFVEIRHLDQYNLG
jgi:hypothetical protein